MFWASQEMDKSILLEKKKITFDDDATVRVVVVNFTVLRDFVIVDLVAVFIKPHGILADDVTSISSMLNFLLQTLP